MRDPEVFALTYSLRHGPSVRYETPPTLDYGDDRFSVRLERGRARFELKKHHSTEQSARKAIEPFIRAWELDVALRSGVDQFQLDFAGAEIRDRQRQPGELSMVAANLTLNTSSPKVLVGLSSYPSPPTGLKWSQDVDFMFYQYIGYKGGSVPIGTMGNFCRDVLEKSIGVSAGRQAAADYYRVERVILNTLGDLADEKGGRSARKAKGRFLEFSDQEIRWIEEAVKAIIRRAAEMAHDQQKIYPLVTMADLPSLQ